MNLAFQNRTKKWCENEIDRKRNIKRLRTSIRREYKTQRNLCQNNLTRQIMENNDTIFPHLNEIQVAIGRNGRIFWKHAGLHRLSISKKENIDKVPVIVRYRHKTWQEKRLRAARKPNKLSKQERNHPDIKNLL